MLYATIAHWDIWSIFLSPVFWSGIGGWIFASLVKMAIAARKTHSFDFVYLVSTGGMPSSHSASVVAIFFAIGYTEGFDAPVAVLACAFAIVTMCDAAGVRHAAGEHAKVLNAIVRDLKELKFKPKERLRELLGHTRREVVWGMVTGAAWATALCCLWR